MKITHAFQRSTFMCLFLGAAGALLPLQAATPHVLALSATAESAKAPTITAHPSSAVAKEGASATFSVAATGPDELSYQWFKNGRAITEATAAELVLKAVTPSDGAVYTVTVSNGAGCTTSQPAVLAIDVNGGLFAPIPVSVTRQSARVAALDARALR